MTKILATNSSPNMDKGNTALILTPFIEGMKEAGADVELIYTTTRRGSISSPAPGSSDAGERRLAYAVSAMIWICFIQSFETLRSGRWVSPSTHLGLVRCRIS